MWSGGYSWVKRERRPERGAAGCQKRAGTVRLLKKTWGAELRVAPEKDIQETLGLGRGGEGNVPEERR